METIITVTYENAYQLKFKTSTPQMMHWIDEAEQALKMAGVKSKKWQITNYETV